MNKSTFWLCVGKGAQVGAPRTCFRRGHEPVRIPATWLLFKPSYAEATTNWMLGFPLLRAQSVFISTDRTILNFLSSNWLPPLWFFFSSDLIHTHKPTGSACPRWVETDHKLLIPSSDAFSPPVHLPRKVISSQRTARSTSPCPS